MRMSSVGTQAGWGFVCGIHHPGGQSGHILESGFTDLTRAELGSIPTHVWAPGSRSVPEHVSVGVVDTVNRVRLIWDPLGNHATSVNWSEKYVRPI
ncbi:hypothetical protein WJX74_009594 [Apatococcus lobatus]|uniref:Uncharacterized protein n=1 Tax=Apatococcus lobatus TaxID=904363 RepID=A0AAW1SH82_9CHLO